MYILLEDALHTVASVRLLLWWWWRWAYNGSEKQRISLVFVFYTDLAFYALTRKKIRSTTKTLWNGKQDDQPENQQ